MRGRYSQGDFFVEFGIESYDQLTKNDLESVAQIYENLEPDVQKDIVSEYPNFKGLVNELLKTYEKIYEGEKEKDDRYYRICDDMVDSVRKMLKSPFLSYKKRIEIMDRLFEIEERVRKKNLIDKVLPPLTIFCGAVLAVVLGKRTI